MFSVNKKKEKNRKKRSIQHIIFQCLQTAKWWRRYFPHIKLVIKNIDVCFTWPINGLQEVKLNLFLLRYLGGLYGTTRIRSSLGSSPPKLTLSVVMERPNIKVELGINWWILNSNQRILTMSWWWLRLEKLVGQPWWNNLLWMLISFYVGLEIPPRLFDQSKKYFCDLLTFW